MSDLPPSNEDQPEATIRVTTGARLHFGLLSTRSPFGGAGVMIGDPQTEVLVAPSATFSCAGPHQERILRIAQRLTKLTGASRLPNCCVRLLSEPPTHSGLGSGTQISLSIAEAMSCFLGEKIEPDILATQVADRGHRSAVGVHGYFRGGFVFESAQDTAKLNPLQCQIELPSTWTIALFQPNAKPATVSGGDELEKFSQLSAQTGEDSDGAQTMLREIIQQQMLPAVAQADFARFATSVSHYNRHSGELFRAVQGGPYNGPQVTGVVEALVARGATGVGQSSWGPTVFAWFANSTEATDFLSRFPTELATGQLTSVRNQPRSLSIT